MCSGLSGLILGHNFKEITTSAKETTDGTWKKQEWKYVVCCTRCGEVISFSEDTKEDKEE